MRDPRRIERIIDLIRKVWYENPDLRLCQLIMNHIPNFRGDPYYVEDDLIEEKLKEYCKDRGI